MKNPREFWGKLILVFLLAAAIVGFFYFEPSNTLRIIAVFFGGGSLFWAFYFKGERVGINPREVAILFILYLSLSSIYNLLYSLGIPLAIVMATICFLVFALFFGLLILEQIDEAFGAPKSNMFAVLSGLVFLELFLSLAFWPVDPKFKSLILVVVFYSITNLIYLYAKNVLRLKRILGFLIISMIVLLGVILTIFLGNRMGIK